MKVINFKELYKFYQETTLRIFEEELENRGWKIINRRYTSTFSTDLALLQVEFKHQKSGEEGNFYFGNLWREFLFVDRDEVPLRLDERILDQSFGLEKITHYTLGRVEFLDALLRNDKEKLHALGKTLGRIKGSVPLDPKDPSMGSLLIHYENGVEQPDSGSMVKEENHD